MYIIIIFIDLHMCLEIFVATKTAPLSLEAKQYPSAIMATKTGL